MTKTKSFDYDLGYIRAGLEVLERYLLSEDIFWPLGISPPEGEPDYPRLTLDGILLARVRLIAHSKTAQQKALVDEVISNLDLQRSRRKVAWEKKAKECNRVRLRMWGDFIQEYRDNPGDNADRYTYEARLRAMLTLLRDETGTQNPAEVELLNSLDRYLKSVLVTVGFIWDQEIQAGFPQDKYWYLYGKLPPLARKPR